MKILTKEEEQENWKSVIYYLFSLPPPLTPYADLLWYSETVKGGLVGGFFGLGLGVAGVYGAGVRYPAFRQITLPLRAFLCTSSATFGGK